MFDLDHWQEIWAALSKNKIRTGLTAFGVFWGIFMLVIMLGSGNGLQNGVMRDFSGGATNSFFVWTQRTSKPYRGLPAGRRLRLTNEDTPAIRRGVPEAQVIAPRNQLGGYRGGNNVTRGSRAGAFSVMGDYPQIQSIQALRLDSGRFLNELDLAERRKVAVVGSRVVDLLFDDDENPLARSIRINGVYFKVVGVFRSPQTGDQGDEHASTIYVPFSTFQNAFNYGNVVGWFAITSADGVPASVARDRVLTLLRARHRVAPDDRRAFGSYNTEEEFNQIQGLFRGISTLIWIVGIGTLAAGIIGVSNIMLVIVKERTREIGVRRAVGATPLSVMGQIVLEALLLTGVAGYAGLMAGMALLESGRWAMQRFEVDAQMFVNPDVSATVALQAMAILIASGALAGLIPARRAVSVSTVDALRHG